MSYSIGDVSRVLGMTPSALHFYEKEGIIDTPKEESGRRYYEDADVNRLISAKKYRAMGVPLRDIARQFSRDGMTGEQVLVRMREKRAEAERLSAQYAALAGDIDRLIELGERGIGAAGQVDIRPAEDILLFQASDSGFLPRERAEQRIVQRWLEAMPAVSVAIVQERGGRAAFALAITARRAQDFGFMENGKNVRRVPGGMALHAVVHCGEEQYERPEAIFDPLRAFAREHRFAPRDALYGSVLFVDCAGGVRKHFYDTYMVIE